MLQPHQLIASIIEELKEINKRIELVSWDKIPDQTLTNERVGELVRELGLQAERTQQVATQTKQLFNTLRSIAYHMRTHYYIVEAPSKEEVTASFWLLVNDYTKTHGPFHKETGQSALRRLRDQTKACAIRSDPQGARMANRKFFVVKYDIEKDTFQVGEEIE